MIKNLELTDTQIALLIKNALEFNASIISNASFIYGQDIKQSTRQRFAKDMDKQMKTYTKNIQEILNDNI